MADRTTRTPDMVSAAERKQAPEGWTWVCCACGKRSADMDGRKAISDGWDSSCSTHCILARNDVLVLSSDKPDARVSEILPRPRKVNAP